MKRMHLVIAATALSVMASEAATIIAHYDMEDQSSTQLTDVSGNANHAPFGGSGHAYVTDSAADTYAYSRTGGWQNIPTINASSGVLSLSLWYRDPDAVVNTEIVWGNGVVSGKKPWIYVANGGSNDQKLVAEWPGTPNPQYLTSGNSVIVRDTWQHLVIVMDSNADTVKGYVNGTLEINASGTNFTSEMGGHLGNVPNGTQTNVAMYDDVQFYDGELSSSDVNFLKNNPGLVVPEPSSAALLGLGGLALVFRRRK